jgi:hypothetical protein
VNRTPAVAFAVLFLALSSGDAPAEASVTIGQLAPGSPSAFCHNNVDRVQPTVTAGNSYIVPATGGVTAWTLTSWSHNATSGADQQLTLKVFRKIGDPDVYMVVGHDGPRPLTPGIVNIFPTSIPVRAGDVLGNNGFSVGTTACFFTPSSPSDNFLSYTGGLSDGQSAAFSNDVGRLNVSAMLDPTDTFTIGRVARNTKKGTATLSLTLPNPGDLTALGKGVKTAATRAVTSKSVPAGATQLLIKARGRKKSALDATGRVRLRIAIIYTPTNGVPRTQSVKVKLIKR